MFTRFDATKSTKGASKLRRDLINAEIANLRDLLPLPQSTRQRLSQLQLMALVCVYVRKANYFQQVFKRREIGMHQSITPNIGFSKALSGFLMMLTQNGKLLYISDNAAEYLGHSMEDLLIHGDSVYDIIDKQDHGPIQAELGRSIPQQQGSSHSNPTTQLDGEQRIFLCRMNVSRNARRQMRFGDQKVVLVQGHYLSYLPLCSRNEPVFLANCTPVAMPETRECVVQGATNVFTTVHSMDMKILHIDKNGEYHTGYNRTEIQGISWYSLLHWECIREAQTKHRLITQSEQDRSCILLLRMQRPQGTFYWVHTVLQVRDGQDANQQSVIVCTNQVLSDREASVMIANSWLYHFYSVQSKIQFGLPYEGPARLQNTTPYYNHPITLQPGISQHNYSSPHQSSYGYQSPHSSATIHDTTHGIIGHHNGNSIGSQNTGFSDYRPYTYHFDSTQPVDYSQPDIKCTNDSENNCMEQHKDNLSQIRIRSPSNKKRVINRLEPLYIPEQNDSSESTLIDISSENSQSTSEIYGQTTVLLSSMLPTRTRVSKSYLIEPTPNDVEQWNPSPPWSDSAQKVPDITHQELSPYMTTTPPTPTSAPLPLGTAFSFDWMPEQFVPVVDCNRTCFPCVTKDGLTVPMSVSVSLQVPHWPMNHRLLPLQNSNDKLSDEESKEIEDQRRSH